MRRDPGRPGWPAASGRRPAQLVDRLGDSGLPHGSRIQLLDAQFRAGPVDAQVPGVGGDADVGVAAAGSGHGGQHVCAGLHGDGHELGLDLGVDAALLVGGGDHALRAGRDAELGAAGHGDGGPQNGGGAHDARAIRCGHVLDDGDVLEPELACPGVEVVGSDAAESAGVALAQGWPIRFGRAAGADAVDGAAVPVGQEFGCHGVPFRSRACARTLSRAASRSSTSVRSPSSTLWCISRVWSR